MKNIMSYLSICYFTMPDDCQMYVCVYACIINNNIYICIHNIQILVFFFRIKKIQNRVLWYNSFSNQNMGLPRWLTGKELACQCRRLGCVTGSRRPLGKENGNLLQYSCLGYLMDRGAWRAIVHMVAKSWRWLSD